MDLRIRVSSIDGDPVRVSARLRVLRFGSSETLTMSTSDGLLRFPVLADDELLSLVVSADGYWTVRQDLTSGPPPSSIDLEVLPAGGRQMWWHDVMGMVAPDIRAGFRVRIGIIDTGFRPDRGLDQVRVLDPAGRAVQSERTVALTHGEIVARLIGQTPEDGFNFGGLAPGAEIVAIDVSHASGGFDPVHVANSIVKLAVDYRCHLINFSGGRYKEKPGLLASIRKARAAGALCIVAAGNEDRDRVAFPARYPECVAVGAIGCRDWGPLNSQVRYFSDMTPENDGRFGHIDGVDVYHFALSCYGEGLDVVAPGVGLVICRGDDPVTHSTGTSFAAPLVTGSLATVLAADDDYMRLGATRERADRAQRTLRQIAKRSGIEAKREGMGVPRCGGAKSGLQ